MKYLDLLISLCYIMLLGGNVKMCNCKEKLQNCVDWIKLGIFLIGTVASAIIVISSFITMPEKLNNHEIRILKVEKDLNEIKIDTVAKLTSLQEDVRLIKEVLLKKK